MTVKLYVEGGGEGAMLQSQCRAGFREFLHAAGLRGRMPRIVACGPRNAVFDAFAKAMRARRDDEFPLLLVDSEDTVAGCGQALEHLKLRDRWISPNGTADDQAFLMVRCMETWLLADRDALRAFFGECWRDTAIPAWPRLEDIERTSVFDALRDATASCGRKRYSKGKISFDLLAAVSPAKVENACPRAKEFLDRLRRF